MAETQPRSGDFGAATGNAKPVISVRHVRMGYGARVLIDDASFDVRRGEIMVIMGGSGSGKSSLMKLIIALYPPIACDILIDCMSMVRGSQRYRAQWQRNLG